MPHALIVAAWSLFGSGPHAEQHFSFAISAPGRVRVETSNGSIDVSTGSPGAGITVTVTKRADTLEQVRALDVTAQRHGNDVTLRGVYPRGCSDSCSGEISFAIVVPPGTALDLTTSNGHVSAARISGDARLQSSNGSVRASYAALDVSRQVSLETSNGQVTLELPAPTKIGRLRMNTSVGRINSDWPVRIDRSNFVGGSVDQTLAARGASISLTTTNGSVTLKKI